jgi:hypothetical protein
MSAPSPTPSPAPPPPSWQRWLPRFGLLLVMALVLGVNAAHMRANPLPKLTNHGSAQLVPKIMYLATGYDLWPPGPDEHERMITNVHFYPLASPVPTPPEGGRRGLGQLLRGGRLHQLVGPCSQPFSACMPHSMALPALVAAAFPGHPLLVNLVPTAWLLLLLAALYGVGSELRDRWTGLCAAAVAAGYPGLFGHARFMEGYIPAAALSVAMIYCLLRSRCFSRPLPVLGFGLMAWTALRNGEGFSEGLGVGLAVAGPFAVVLARGLWAAWKVKRVPWRSLLSLGALGGWLWFSTDIFWVRSSMNHVFGGFSDLAVAAGSAPGAPWPWLHPLVPKGAYALLIWSDYLLPVLGLAALLALPLFLIRGPRHRLLLLLWWLVPFVAYSIQLRKSMWYPVPMLPPLALMTAIGLASLPTRWPRTIAMTTVAGLALLQLILLSSSWGLERFPEDSWLRESIPTGVVDLRGYDLCSPGDPRQQALATQAQRLLELAGREVPRSDRLKYIAVLGPIGPRGALAADLAYWFPLARPDLVAITLGDPLNFDQARFQGLEPADFAYLLQVDEGSVVPCCTVDPGPQAPVMPDTRALDEFLTRLEAASSGPVVDWPELIRLPAARDRAD